MTQVFLATFFYLAGERLYLFARGKEAANIDYQYEYEGFLPDYSFTLGYNLPNDKEVDTLSYNSDGFSKTQSFVFDNNRKRVTYSEAQQ